jgi:hypothetical protein
MNTDFITKKKNTGEEEKKKWIWKSFFNVSINMAIEEVVVSK